jgi:uncharacterized RDD family membrane protein YckC
MSEYPFPKASIQHRLGGKAVDYAMYSVTFGIGWIIWSLVVWGQGQTPGKQIVKLRVYNKTNFKRVTWGHMAIREFGLPASISIIFWLTLLLSAGDLENASDAYVGVFVIIVLAIFLVDIFWIFKDDKKNRLVDVICKTDVLNESPQASIQR